MRAGVEIENGKLKMEKAPVDCRGLKERAYVPLVVQGFELRVYLLIITDTELKTVSIVAGYFAAYIV